MINQLALEIQSWQTDESTIIKIPLEQKDISRSEAYQLINGLIKIMQKSAPASNPGPTIGLNFEDPKNWILSIVAAKLSNFIAVPIPKEFTLSQITSFVPNLDFVLTDSAESADRLSKIFKTEVQISSYSLTDDSTIFLLNSRGDLSKRDFKLPAATAAVIHTSGSTDSPKGVVISDQGLSEVIRSMLERVKSLSQIHYVSVLPYSLLLEQVLGIYLPILTKGTIAILPRAIDCYVGTQTSLDPYLQTMRSSGSNFTMVPPSYLTHVQKLASQSQTFPRDYFGTAIEVVATGGAPIGINCLEYFKENQIEIYQGYGLSENSSVVTWSYPGPNVLGSVGQPLSHNKVRINSNGQVEVLGDSMFLGYVSNGKFLQKKDGWLNTGDLGYFDENGNLYITGRDSNLIVLSTGRNVAPEWIENRYRLVPGVKDFIVVGHGRAFLAAIVLVDKNFECDSVLQNVVIHAKTIAGDFPDFARVLSFRAIPFDDQFYSVSGRILRSRLLEKHVEQIDKFYCDEETKGVRECKTISL